MSVMQLALEESKGRLRKADEKRKTTLLEVLLLLQLQMLLLHAGPGALLDADDAC